MRILALDQSSSHSGFAVIEDGKLGDIGCVNVPESLDLYMRTVAMSKDIDVLIRKYNPDYLVLEEIYGMPGRYTALKALAIVRGALIHLWWERSFSNPVVIQCNTARVQLGIKGNAKKHEVMAAVNAKFKLKITNEHEADAVVLAVVGYDLLKKTPTKSIAATPVKGSAPITKKAVKTVKVVKVPTKKARKR